MPNRKYPPQYFKTIQLSRIAYNAMTALENAVEDKAVADDAASMHSAYSRLNAAREQLALHISHLEHAARLNGARGINPTIIVRYR